MPEYEDWLVDAMKEAETPTSGSKIIFVIIQKTIKIFLFIWLVDGMIPGV